MKKVTQEIQTQIEFTRVYEVLGAQEPQWIVLETIMPRSSLPASIILKTDVEGISVFADPVVEKVFFNLLDNSIRHGQFVSEIIVSSIITDNNLTVIWKDNGVGIAKEDKERIFERGFGKNTGLGMFLAREILSLTDISIQETGMYGSGAKFEIKVPKGLFRNTNSGSEKGIST